MLVVAHTAKRPAAQGSDYGYQAVQASTEIYADDF